MYENDKDKPLLITNFYENDINQSFENINTIKGSQDEKYDGNGDLKDSDSSKFLDKKTIHSKKKKKTNVELHDVKDNKNNKSKTEYKFEIKKIGFPNLGNSCYMNSFLQILINTPDFIEELIDLKKIKNIDDELINSLINLSKNPIYPIPCLTNIKNIMGKIDQSYSEICQNDSQKFGIDLLDKVISIIKNEKVNDSSEEEKENSNRFKDNLNDLKKSKIKKFKDYKCEVINTEISLEKIFLFHESQIQMERETNKITNIRFESFLNVNINLSNNSIKEYDLIEQLKNIYCIDTKKEIKYEIIVQNELFNEESNISEIQIQRKKSCCQRFYNCICNCVTFLVSSLKSLFYTNKTENKTYFSLKKICRLPKILIITINRAFLGLPLDMNKLHFERSLDIGQFLDLDILDISKQNTEYILYAVNECSGNSKNSGHYYSYIYIQDKWYKFNDQKVTESNPNFDSEYVVGLFYIKKE